MMYENPKVSDRDESVLDLTEIVKVELENDNVQSLSTRCDETIIAMNKQSDDEILEMLLYRQHQHSGQLKPWHPYKSFKFQWRSQNKWGEAQRTKKKEAEWLEFGAWPDFQ